MNNIFRLFVAAAAVVATRFLLFLARDKRVGGLPPARETGEKDELSTPPPVSFVRRGETRGCCDAAVFVGDISFLGVPIPAWRNVGREIKSDLEDLGFDVTLDTTANKQAVYDALANPSLKMLVIIGHGEKDDTTAIIYMAGDDPTGLNFVDNTGIAAAIQQAHGGPHPCLAKVILESCFAGKSAKMDKWSQALGIAQSAIIAPTGRTNGIAQYYRYFFKTDYGVVPDESCLTSGATGDIAPVTGSTVTNPRSGD